MLRGKP